MKILYIHTRYMQSAGGEDATVSAEVDLMRNRGHDVMVQFFDNAKIVNGIGGKVSAGISTIYNKTSAKKVAELIEMFNPDIVHVHNFFFTASPSVLIEVSRRKIPLIVTLHNFRLICANSLLLRHGNVCELCVHHDFPWHGVRYRCYHNSAIQSAMVGATAAIHKWTGTWKKRVTCYITPSAFSRNRLLNSSLGVAENQIVVKHNFVEDPGVGEYENRESFYLFVGRLSMEKGLEVLLKAWQQLKEQKLIVVGDGPESDTLRQQYEHLTNVSFVGKKPKAEVFDLMRRCRALIFPSIWYEGLPLTIIEALATGTPVMASSLGAMKEIVTDQLNGVLFEPKNPDAIVKAVEQFNSSVDLGNAEMYQAARTSYLKGYHPDICYQHIMQIYTRAILHQKNDR